MGRSICFYLTVLSLFGLSVELSAATYSGGSGTPGKPYKIATPADLITLGSTPGDYGKSFILTADINMAEQGYNSDGSFLRALIAPDIVDENWDYDGVPFTGHFNGNGHVIYNLAIDTQLGSVPGMYLGLFGSLAAPAVVENLGLDDLAVTGGDGSYCIGGLCGYNEGGTITNCYVVGTINGEDSSQYLGSLCGYNSFGNISDCYVTGHVVANYVASHLGGLCGQNSNGSIVNTDAECDIYGGGMSSCLGGLCGSNYNGVITNCTVTGMVKSELADNGASFLGGLCGISSGTSEIIRSRATAVILGNNESNYLGGLCGCNESPIADCYAEGQLTADLRTYRLGGLCGYNSSSLTDCYASVAIIADEGSTVIGGLCGQNDTGTITDCHALGVLNIDGESWGVGGLCGSNTSGTIVRCYARGTVGGGGISQSVGGLCGNNSGSLSDCYADGDVSGGGSWMGGIGGFCGSNTGIINHCFAAGAVVGFVYAEDIGGFCGINHGDARISTCYAAGDVSGKDFTVDIGGFVGRNAQGRILSCYSAGKLTTASSSQNIGGFCGAAQTGGGFQDTGNFWDTRAAGIVVSAMGVGKSAEMKTRLLFTSAGWDFIKTWGIEENQTYPFLLRKPSSDLNDDGIVNLADFALFAEDWLQD